MSQDKPITDLRSGSALASFNRFCMENPSLRFWQALSAWSGWHYVGVSADLTTWRDTFYWENRNG